jgi:protein-S-isoprenylcysteine O-methyltransferase Ste14
MTRKLTAAAGSAAFLVVTPGTVAGVLPWSFTQWDLARPLDHWAPVRLCGAVLIVLGLAVLLHAFARFVTEGLGTPAPVAPTDELVTGGAYRYVRNPMYLAVAAIIIGQALLLWQLGLLLYAALFAILVWSFVHFYEEPTLRERYGASYDAYRSAVPGWHPRLRAWRPEREPRRQ